MIDASANKQLAAYRLGITECQVPSQQNLTEAERRAITWAANVTDDGWPGSHAKQMIATLRGLLERMK